MSATPETLLTAAGLRRAFVDFFIENGHHLITAPFAQLVMNEVAPPDGARLVGPQAEDGAVLVIQSFLLFRGMGKLKASPPP